MEYNSKREPLLEMFIFETLQLLQQLEQIILDCEKTNSIQPSINEFFRIMHTIKGSAAMMLFENIAALAHAVEDLFSFLRETNPINVSGSAICDVVLEGIDFIKDEIKKIESNTDADGNSAPLIEKVNKLLNEIKKADSHILQNESTCSTRKKNKFLAAVFFEEGCEMENIRAFAIIHHLKGKIGEIKYLPEDILDNEEAAKSIQKDGFKILFTTDLIFEDVEDILNRTAFLKELKLDIVDDEFDILEDRQRKEITFFEPEKEIQKEENISIKQDIISVNLNKLDKLMNLVGELVISESLVLQNPDLAGLSLDNFTRAARQLNKITNEIQDIVMSIRLISISATFQKMNRIVRDMSKKLDKSIHLELIGAETEADKNIIEHISDPLIHLIRNAIDHGIESSEERKANGKPGVGNIILEAKSSGREVWIILKDDGRGLDKEKILNKASKAGLLKKPASEMTDKEIYSLIFKAGFSTKDAVTEFSGRGVGMDVVLRNIEKVRGSVSIDSNPGEGTSILIKIPLTLAIIDGMLIQVGQSSFIIPTVSIGESFKVSNENIIRDCDGNELILVRGECYPLVRLHEKYCIESNITKISEGIVIMVENDNRMICIFADSLLDTQQVVVKPLPDYIKKLNGIAGCTLLGNGNISLILDIANLVNTA